VALVAIMPIPSVLLHSLVRCFWPPAPATRRRLLS
jgi:hypothetical protein